MKALAAALLLWGAVSAPAQALPYQPYPPPKDLSGALTALKMQALNPGVGACDSYTVIAGCTPGPGSVLLIGDSISNQMNPAFSACGVNILRFTLNGLEVHDVLPNVDALIAAAQPRAIIVALGKNDMTDGRLSFWNWQQDSFWLVADIEGATQAVMGRVVRPVLLTIPPPERAAPFPWNNPPLLNAFNAYLAINSPAQGNNVAAVFGAPVVDFARPPHGVSPIVLDGPYLPAGFTDPSDGFYIHPVGDSNTLVWAYYAAAVKAALAENGEPCPDAAPPQVP